MLEILFDSSALIELVFRHRDMRMKVEAAVPVDSKRLTSRYVLFEIARGYLRSLLVLHNKAMAVESLQELHEYMHSGQQQFKTYRRETMLGAYEDYLAHIQTLGISLTEKQRLSHFRGWLAQLLRRGWRKATQAAEPINRVRCREDLSPPILNSNGCYDQPLPTRECGLAEACGIDGYFSECHADFQKIAEGLAMMENSDPETERRVKALRRLLTKTGGADFDGQDCWSCGDAIICHEAPGEAVILSKNRKHFEPLCALIGRKLQTYR